MPTFVRSIAQHREKYCSTWRAHVPSRVPLAAGRSPGCLRESSPTKSPLASVRSRRSRGLRVGRAQRATTAPRRCSLTSCRLLLLTLTSQRSTKTEASVSPILRTSPCSSRVSLRSITSPTHGTPLIARRGGSRRAATTLERRASMPPKRRTTMQARGDRRSEEGARAGHHLGHPHRRPRGSGGRESLRPRLRADGRRACRRWMGAPGREVAGDGRSDRRLVRRLGGETAPGTVGNEDTRHPVTEPFASSATTCARALTHGPRPSCLYPSTHSNPRVNAPTGRCGHVEPTARRSTGAPSFPLGLVRFMDTRCTAT